MKIPKRIEPLVEEGLVDEVICQLMSGKEAMVYMVRSGKDIFCAKVYKEPNMRSFHKTVDYTEGRRGKNIRRFRAMEKGTRYGRRTQEGAWQSIEVDSLYRLAASGVRVPRPYNFFEGVLLMELVTDTNGDVAPRLNDIVLTAERAREYHRVLAGEVVRMLCVDLIHGDLSEYNVLAGSDGPVIIDLPQAINAAGNNNAFNMLVRDMNNLTAYFGRFDPELLNIDYSSEIWSFYQRGKLHPGIPLIGRVAQNTRPVHVGSVLQVIDSVLKKEAALQRYKQEMRG
ncbi:MAG: PA4780 family RIO1-like protein kinase [Nitrosospira sp.]